MLEKITIDNYRCYDKHEIEFRNLSIIVGKNNAGKSTLVEALRLVSLALSRFQTVHYSDHPYWLDLPKIARGIRPSLKNIEFKIENVFHAYGDPPASITAEFTGNIQVTIYIGENAEIFCTLKENEVYIPGKSTATKLGIPQLNILPQISAIAKKETILGREYVRQNLSSDTSSLHFRNQLALLYEFFPRFTEMAQNTWPGLRIFNLDGRLGMPGDPLSLLVQDGSFVSEIGWMGSGLQMWVQIMWFLSRIDQSDIVVLDEPDVYMHPDLQRKLIRFLKNKFSQVLVSTHSTEIISEVEAENILIIDKANDKSFFATKMPVVQSILNSIGSMHNLQLTKLWAAKKLLIVEGEDVAILKRIQNVLCPKSNEPFDTIPNFDIGGWGGWNYARGSRMLLKETVDDDIKVYCLFDSDYYTFEQLQERIKEAKKLGVQIHIWQKKEIENYLLVPTAILRILKLESKKAHHLTVADIEKIILQQQVELEDEVVHNVANEIQKMDRKLSVSAAIKKAKQSIDKLENRVSGKAMISKMSTWTQEQYKVSLSPIKLASNLQINEVDIEVVKVVSAIEENKELA